MDSEAEAQRSEMREREDGFVFTVLLEANRLGGYTVTVPAPPS